MTSNTNGKEEPISNGFSRRHILKTTGAVAVAGGFGLGSGVAGAQDLDDLCEAVPHDVMLVLDRSGSMGLDPDGDGSTKLDDVKAAAKGFVDRLTSADQVGLVSYNENATVDSQLTGDHASVKSAIDGLSAGGLTNIGGAVDTAHDELTGALDRADADNIMVLLSNGQPTTGPDAATEADEAKADGIRLITIAFGQDANDSLMQDLASDPASSNFFDAPTGADIDTVFQTITQEICPTVVDINIKPGSDPNAVNCRSEVVPVAVLTTSDFDATRVDPASLRFGAPSEVVAGNGAEIVHEGGHFEDAQPDHGEKDGDTDFVGHFATADTGFDGSQDEGWLVGQTMDGEDIAGRDSVKLVGCNRGGN